MHGRCTDDAGAGAGDVDADLAGRQVDGAEGCVAVEKQIECMLEMITI